MSTIKIPELALVVLIGPSGSGKSSFARKHFKPTEILSSDFCRGLVSDDENDQAATKDAFETLHFIARKRLAAARLTVVDATNVQPEARKPLVALAREFHALPVAIVLNLPERVCRERNEGRADRTFGPHVIRQQRDQLKRSIRNLGREGFRHVFVLNTPEDVDAVQIVRDRLYNNKKDEKGPFDIIGDIHGCFDELRALLEQLGYLVSGDASPTAHHPEGRRAVFVGDLVDRGPKIPEVLDLVMNMVEAGSAFAVPGNHDMKLLKKLRGKDVKITHGLAETIDQLEQRTPEFRAKVEAFIDGLISHYVFDEGKLVVAHAGMKEEMQGRGSGKVREFALFGETTGETDELGLPVRYNWAADYRGRAMVVYGHVAVLEPEWINRTICIDTGCVYGGKLTALRYPEQELVSVPAARMYYEPMRPLAPAVDETPATLSAQQELDDLLEIEDVIGKRIISTRLRPNITIREENAMAAIEVMSRFAANPKWLVYLPPTMSPSETTKREGLLEHPAEAFEYYRHEGVAHVICEEKHMGSRAVVIVCRDEEAARKRFGVVGEGIGIVYTRTGRRFFTDANAALEAGLLAHLRDALTAADLWAEFSTDWFIFDCELMPWSLKAEELVRDQYAAVGAVASSSLRDARKVLETAEKRLPELAPLAKDFGERAEMVAKYVEAYGHYCWTVKKLDDLRLAPFHVLASEGAVHTDKTHTWHMETIARFIPSGDTILVATPYRVIDLSDSASEGDAIAWWESLTIRGGEGMVVKPMDFVAKGRRGLLQPAVKCRGPEYLRIIYGPEYTSPKHLERLRHRGLAGKRSLALREFALGIESLERFIARDPLRRIHECVFGVLALESEPVDSRL
jgi:protein phosphatase